jgi:hypothetical protein
MSHGAPSRLPHRAVRAVPIAASQIPPQLVTDPSLAGLTSHVSRTRIIQFCRDSKPGCRSKVLLFVKPNAARRIELLEKVEINNWQASHGSSVAARFEVTGKNSVDRAPRRFIIILIR